MTVLLMLVLSVGTFIRGGAKNDRTLLCGQCATVTDAFEPLPISVPSDLSSITQIGRRIALVQNTRFTQPLLINYRPAETKPWLFGLPNDPPLLIPGHM